MSDIKINFELIRQLSTRPHPLLNIAEDFEAQIRETPLAWTAEVFTEARTAHHLLDIGGIARGREGSVYSSDLDARTYLAVAELSGARGRLGRIADQHLREADPPTGAFSDLCRECGHPWPCFTWKQADGVLNDLS